MTARQQFHVTTCESCLTIVTYACFTADNEKCRHFMTSHPSSSSHRRRKRVSERPLPEKSRVQAMGVPAEYSAEDNPHKTNKGLLRAWHALRNSWSGLVFAV